MAEVSMHDRVTKALRSLAVQRPVFHSEADLREELVRSLNAQNPDWLIQTEVPLGGRKRLDILISTENWSHGIELKHKTARFDVYFDGKSYKLKAHGAPDQARFDVLSDIARMEEFAANGATASIILLTNYSKLWEPAGADNIDAEFGLEDGRTLPRQMAWGSKAGSGSLNGRSRSVEIRGTHTLRWQEFSSFPAKNGRFRMLCVPISGQGAITKTAKVSARGVQKKIIGKDHFSSSRVVGNRSPTAPAAFAAQTGSHVVEFWSERRLPLQPTDQLLAVRSELRQLIRNLPASKQLMATYRSEVHGYFDVENILIYNVGTSTFSATPSLAFHHEFGAAPPCPAYPDKQYPHYHRYELVEAFSVPSEAVVAETEFCLQRLSSSTKPHEVWWSVEPWQVLSAARPSCFGLEIEISGPTKGRHAGAFLKPLIDGVVCSLHHQSVPGEFVCQYLSQALGTSSAKVQRRLQDNSSSILGERSDLVTPYRTGVYWRPDDHLCRYGAIRLARSHTGAWAGKVRLLELTPIFPREGEDSRHRK